MVVVVVVGGLLVVVIVVKHWGGSGRGFLTLTRTSFMSGLIVTTDAKSNTVKRRRERKRKKLENKINLGSKGEVKCDYV